MAFVTFVEADQGATRDELRAKLSSLAAKGKIRWFCIEDATLREWQSYASKYDKDYDLDMFNTQGMVLSCKFRKVVFETCEPFMDL